MREGVLAGLRRAGATVPVADGLLALAVAVFAQLDLQFDLDNSTHYGSDLLTALAAAVVAAALLLRRRAPLACACVMAAAVGLPELVGEQTITLWGHFAPLVIGCYSVSRHAERRRVLVGAAVIVAAVLVAMLRLPVLGTVDNIPFTAIPLIVAFAAGRIVRARVAQHRRTAELAARLAEQERTVTGALVEERARIARELHDIVAHCVGVMVIQAGAAEDLLARAPADARAPLRAVQDTGQQAVAELSRVLGLLRGGDERGLTPQPGTGELAELVDGVRRAGLPVALEVRGCARPLPPGVDLTVYRVVQEALTNTLKHAGPATARVLLTYGEHDVRAAVVDDGRAAPPSAPVGHGLLGLRERVGLYGGELSAGPGTGRGFAVHARIPVPG
jgi:signal transduction histidine kinase